MAAVIDVLREGGEWRDRDQDRKQNGLTA